MKEMTRLVRAIVLKLMYPCLMLIGSFSKNKREKLQILIIKLNNRLVQWEWSRDIFQKKDLVILLLLPQCLQMDTCNIRITTNVYNCKKCGKCIIAEVIELAEVSHLDLFVASGGTIARRIVDDLKPDAIIAVACERDLSSGIVDSYPIPVLGLINERPSGPCINTKIDKKKLLEAINFFTKGTIKRDLNNI